MTHRRETNSPLRRRHAMPIAASRLSRALDDAELDAFGGEGEGHGFTEASAAAGDDGGFSS